jgi:hypothetical protein
MFTAMYQKYYLHIQVNRTVPTKSLSTYTVSQHSTCNATYILSFPHTTDDNLIYTVRFTAQYLEYMYPHIYIHNAVLIIFLSTHPDSQHTTFSTLNYKFRFTAQYLEYLYLYIYTYSTVFTIFLFKHLGSQHTTCIVLIYKIRSTAQYSKTSLIRYWLIQNTYMKQIPVLSLKLAFLM